MQWLTQTFCYKVKKSLKEGYTRKERVETILPNYTNLVIFIRNCVTDLFNDEVIFPLQYV